MLECYSIYYLVHLYDILSQPVVDTDTVMKDHSRLTATVLDFESHLVKNNWHDFIVLYYILVCMYTLVHRLENILLDGMLR